MQTPRQNYPIMRKSSRRSREKTRFVTFPPIPNKLYFSIGEASRLCFVESYVIRFWERVFTQLKPAKVSIGGRRYYGREEIVLIRTIRDLLYTQGFTAAGARAQLTRMQISAADIAVDNNSHAVTRGITAESAGCGELDFGDAVKQQQSLMEQKEILLRGLSGDASSACGGGESEVLTVNIDDGRELGKAIAQEQYERNEMVRKNLLKDILAHVDDTLSLLESKLEEGS